MFDSFLQNCPRVGRQLDVAPLSDSYSNDSWWQGQAQHFSLGGGAKTEGRERGWVLVEGSKPPPHQLGVWGSATSSLSGILGGAPTAQRFSAIFSTQDGLS